MEEKELTFDDAPLRYPICYNEQCSKHGECMHYHMGTLVPSRKKLGWAVYPTAWKDGECSFFREKHPVRMAWGFNGIYKKLSKHDAADARVMVRQYFNMGKGEYYRHHHGEKLLSPKQQQEILHLVSLCGSIEGVEFDHYVTAYDFT